MKTVPNNLGKALATTDHEEPERRSRKLVFRVVQAGCLVTQETGNAYHHNFEKLGTSIFSDVKYSFACRNARYFNNPDDLGC